ncbi:hypothetical protein [Wansuia hejianensis]|uniref:Uncharacterized protein n=1 Tax=Wansuia hejianensis TaxID=2763667 RepID=A0A7G9GDW7_9FIRM|nr:hypothetical protein [Wansuia hejianensis]QNM08999.1 hypothetical protein H9Q79_01480 [Wansuia hejianensis]RHV88275.1 hypothetical protein DXA96_11425 [Lachnospiraceae bacterium OF09-33XD]
MSQEKVDQYKKNKANRQKIMRREKILRRLEITVAALVLVGLVSWFSVAVYKNSKAQAQANAETVTTSLDVSAINDYMNEANSAATASE